MLDLGLVEGIGFGEEPVSCLVMKIQTFQLPCPRHERTFCGLPERAVEFAGSRIRTENLPESGRKR